MATTKNNGRMRVERGCSFCGRSEDQVEFLIPSPTGLYICDKCIDACNDIIFDHFSAENEGGAHASLAEQSLPKPMEIKATLDEYIIGQDRAKIALSVAVYNHYKRLIQKDAKQKLENAAGAAARALGYSEIITYSFVSPSSFDAIRIPADSPLRKTVKLVNPLGEDTSIMRTVILPSMLDILSRNFAFKNKGVKLYEIGKIYLPVEGEKLPNEPKRMIFGTYGEHENFFTLKGEVDALLEQLNVHPATYVADTKNPSYHPGRCADIMIDGKKLGVIGQIHPLVAEGYGISGEVYVAELDFTGLQSALAPERVFHSLPKFPTVSRDLALVCDEAMTVGMLEACIKKAGGKLLRSIQLFDIYRGPGIAPGKKSVAFSLELRADDRTLTDEDTTGVTNAVLEKLKNDLGVTLR